MITIGNYPRTAWDGRRDYTCAYDAEEGVDGNQSFAEQICSDPTIAWDEEQVKAQGAGWI
jgi:hypothetical protein